MRSQLVSVASAYPGADWDLLVRLPGRVVIAATSEDADSPDRTVAEGLAGVDAIASGHDSASALVQAVVAAIYSERAGPDGDDADASAVLDSAAAATAMLDERADPADREAYRTWITEIASRVHAASGRDDPDEHQFLDDLSAAFRTAGERGRPRRG